MDTSLVHSAYLKEATHKREHVYDFIYTVLDQEKTSQQWKEGKQWFPTLQQMLCWEFDNEIPDKGGYVPNLRWSPNLDEP